MRLLTPLLSVAFALGVGLVPGCECAQNGHLEPVPFRASVGDTVVQCNCNLSFKHQACINNTCLAHLGVKVCLPPELNVETIDRVHGADAGVALRALDAQTFADRVDAYCRKVVTRTTYQLIRVFNDSWCDYKSAFAPDGGVGESVSCFAYPISGDDATEREETTCARPCPVVACSYDTNCGRSVQDDVGGVHLDRCRCTQVVDPPCPGDPPGSLPTPVFCRPGIP
jgi:hypothetical protein